MKITDTEALKVELSGLYTALSKHSSYQSIPDFVAREIGYQVEINNDWRGDRVRLDYILSQLTDPSHRRWGDFGANTGFFSLSLAHDCPQREVLAIEANSNHASFIERIRDAFALRNLHVIARPIAIDDLHTLPRQDVLLHLNVLHHAGADFDQGRVTGPKDFHPYAREYLKKLHACANTLVFQMGTNLWGDKSNPLIDFRNDVSKLEMITELLHSSGWKVDDVAYATRPNEGPICYESLVAAELAHSNTTQQELARLLEPFNLSQHIGEFYRRPLFTCTSS